MTTLQDATRELEYVIPTDVTAKDATPKDPSACAVANRIGSQLGENGEVRVFRTMTHILGLDGIWRRYRNCRAMVREIARFDDDNIGLFRAGIYYLFVPGAGGKLGDRAKRKKHSKTKGRKGYKRPRDFTRYHSYLNHV